MRSLLWFIAASGAFTLAYAQAPLYFSNQHQYFLHGLAEAGHGHLDQDWLANTADPAPVFTFLVAATARYLHESFFYVYYAVLMGIYFVSLLGLFNVVGGDRATLSNRMAFAALLLLFHAALLRSVSARLFGVDYMWYFQAGLAGQYILGPMLQPSTFGVLLILSLVLFAKGKSFFAITCSSLAAVCHSTYLLPAAMLTVGYLVTFVFFDPTQTNDSETSDANSPPPKRNRWTYALLLGLWALVLVSPVLIYNYLTFRPASMEDFAKAKHILVHFRIPHHAIPRLWFDEIAFLQVLWMIVGIFLARGTRLYPVLLIAFLIGFVLTGLQIVTDSDLLALMFPWRISTILIPMATAIILSRLVLLFTKRKKVKESTDAQSRGSIVLPVSVAIIVLLVVAGIIIMQFRLAFQTRDEELAMMDYVREHVQSGDVYLLPIKVPNLKSSVRGASKSDFRPLKILQFDAGMIPINLQRFRLYTGAPIFVDFKSIPYSDSNVLEWRKRLELNEQIYGKLKAGLVDEAIADMKRLEITHLVTPAHEPIDSDHLKQVYADDFYRVYRLEPFNDIATRRVADCQILRLLS